MKFSVITVCLNAVDTIEQTINSVLNQDYADIEYIIIDGESTDGTLDIIKKYQNKISYWISESDEGIYDAMNKGIAIATGDVFSFLNADDWYEEGIIKKINQYFEDSDVSIVGGAVNYIVDGRYSTVIYSKYDLNKTYIYSACQHQAIFTKKEVFEAIGKFNVNYKLLADYEWMLRVWKNRTRFLAIDDICANFRNSGLSSYYTYDATLESMNAAYNILGNEYKEEIEDFYGKKLEKTYYEQIFECEFQKESVDFIKKILDEQQYYIWGAGRVGIRCCMLFERLGIEIKGFIDNYKYNNLEKILGHNVYAPINIDNGIKICVAVREFENQVEKQLADMGYSDNNYILFSEIIKKAVIQKTGKVYNKKNDIL